MLYNSKVLNSDYGNVLGTYNHIVEDRTDLYEPQRSNHFEFVIDNTINNINNAGVHPLLMQEGEAKFTSGKAAQEILRIAVNQASIPSFSAGTMTIARGNSSMRFAGTPSGASGTLSLRFVDYIGANTVSKLQAWRALTYNEVTDHVGLMRDYKKTCWLLEYTPDYATLVRYWELNGCFIENMSEDAMSSSGTGARNISITLSYDKAIPHLGDEDVVIE